MKRTTMTMLLLLAAASLRAADPISQVFSCAKQGTVGGLGAGTDLTRYTIDVTQYPNAVCNDGTPAVFYYGRYTKNEDRDKWIIFLQGGGSCIDGQTCGERWCSIDTNYGYDKMTTSITKPSIRGVGFLDPDPKNNFGSWNRVLIFYCSSDAWGGTTTKTLSATLNGAPARDYQIHFHGSYIVDAVLDTLRNVRLAGRRHAVTHGISAQADASTWPDLDDAREVMFAGSSGGGAGVRANLDRVGEKLKATNPGLDFRGLIDAIYGTLAENRNFATSVYCLNDPVHGCDYASFSKATQEAIEIGLYSTRGDESCLQWHTAHAPGTEWRCGDGEHVQLNHITTPFFIHQDLQDTSIGGGWVEAGFGAPSDYARAVESELRNLQTPEEPRGATPGLFVPQCTDHESFTNDPAVFRVKLAGISYHDAVWNWWTHTQPQQVIRPFSGTPGKAPECPLTP